MESNERINNSMLQIKRLFFAIFLLVNISINVFAEDAPTKQQFPEYIPQAPQAQAIARAIDIPVNQYTGVPDISLPLYTVEIGTITIPISISYQGGGIRPNQEATSVGLGWTLNAGGAITRTIKCTDDFMEHPVSDSQYSCGYLQKKEWPDDNLKYHDTNYYRRISEPSNSIYEYPGDYYSYVDSEPDLFFYSTPAVSGKFFFKKDSTIVYHDVSQNMRITPSFGGNPRFHALDSEGNVYYFDKKERTHIYSITGVSSSVNMTPGGTDVLYNNSATYKEVMDYTSSWFLTQIISQTNDTIDFEYTDESTQYPLQEECQYVTKQYGASIPEVQEGKVFSWSKTEVEGQQLASIKWRGGHVDFVYGKSRSDIRGSYGAYGPNALTEINVYDDRDNKVSHWRMHYSFFNGGRTDIQSNKQHLFHRLRLDSLENVLTQQDPYRFTYNESVQLPVKNTKNTDFYGYYNGINQYSDYYCQTDSPLESNKAINEDCTKMGVLVSMQHPTGGITKFNWECNRIGEIVHIQRNNIDANYDQYLSPYFLSHENLGQLRGGLRLCSIEGETTKRFYYDNGIEIVPPCYSYRNLVVVARTDGPYITTNTNVYDVRVSSPTRPLSTVKNGNIIGYSKVLEVAADGALTEYNYHNEEEGTEYDSFPSFPSIINWTNGLLQSKICYDDKGNTLNRTENSYTSYLTAPNDTTGFIEMSTGYYFYYRTKVECPKLTSSTYTEYRKNGHIGKVLLFGYNENLLCCEKTERIGSDINKTVYKYANDYSDNMSQLMVRSNMIGIPIAQWSMRNGVIYQGTKTVFGSYNHIQEDGQSVVCGTRTWTDPLFSELYMPRQILTLNTSVVGNDIEDCALDITMVFNNYTKYGKPCDMTYKGMPITYLWAYKGMYPIAKINNATYQQFTSAFGNINMYLTPGDTEYLRDRIWMACEMMPEVSATIDMYKPLVGVANRTDYNGVISEYSYDFAGRLQTERKSNIYYLAAETVCRHNYGNNFVRSITYPTYSMHKNLTSTQYYDAWGRPSLVASQGLATNGTYNYGMQTYDAMGRKNKEYVLVPSSSYSGELIDSVSFTQMSAAVFSNDEYGYTQNHYDRMGRIVKSTMSGQMWHSNDKSTTLEYRVNNDNEVKKYTVTAGNLSESGYYRRGTLDCTVTTDPDGLTIKVYKDLFGNVVLERRANNNDTYYVYDDFNRLRFLLPPMYQDIPDLAAYAYQYEYDGKGRITSKVLPGCAPIHFWYDNKDNIIRMQDGVLAEDGKYRVWEYDGLNRQLSQALIDTNGNRDYESRIYYDNYDFLNGYSLTLPSDMSSLMPVDRVYGKGQITGKWQKASNGETLLSVCGYDNFGYPSSTVNISLDKYMSNRQYTNDLLGNVLEETFSEYEFDSSTNSMKKILSGEIENNYVDLHTNHLTSSVISLRDQFGNTRTDTISNLHYDDFGHVIHNNRGGAKADMMYEYDNMHGWLTKTKSSGSFEQKMFRETDGNIPCYNGNISAMTWKTANNYVRRFDYQYDDLDRLHRADFSYYAINNPSSPDPVLSLIPSVGMENEDYTSVYDYDKNGNILGAYRQGVVDNNRYDEYGLFYDTLDDYIAEYNGNQLKSVNGTGVGNPSYYGSSYFVDGVEEDVEYAYNANGSMTMDLNKGITNIEYDPTGNLKKISLTGNRTINYVYAPDGTRLRTTHSRRIGNTWLNDSIDYRGNLLFKQGKPYMYQFPGGYVSFSDYALGSCHYYIQDYLGNNRMVVNANGSTEQITHYYPYGGVIGGISGNGTAQPFKFEGKELDNTFGLDWYDIHARQYNPVVPSWHAVDPLCEKCPNVSPYVYCMNNPVRFIDLDGRVCGDFYDENGYLGNDGKADNKVYIVKTTKTSFGEGNSQVLGAGLSKQTAKETKKFIKSNSGNTDAFMNNPIAYDNSIEIESAVSTRQAMVNIVSQDNGKGGTQDANNREYGGEITPDGIIPHVGAVYSPKVSSYATIELNSTDYSTFHGHPSGSIVENSNPSTSSSISFSETRTTYSYTQSPSPLDISNANSHTHYVFGRTNGITYIYNSNGVQATIPTSKFVNLPK